MPTAIKQVLIIGDRSGKFQAGLDNRNIVLVALPTYTLPYTPSLSGAERNCTANL